MLVHPAKTFKADTNAFNKATTHTCTTGKGAKSTIHIQTYIIRGTRSEATKLVKRKYTEEMGLFGDEMQGIALMIYRPKGGYTLRVIREGRRPSGDGGTICRL